MKTRRFLTLVSMLLACAVAFASGPGQSVDVNLSSSPVTGQEPEHDENTKNRHRLPSRHIPCVISEAGVSFRMDCPPEILVYEIADTDGNVIATCGDEASFVQTLFSLTGEYTVVFTTAEYVYYGCVNI